MNNIPENYREELMRDERYNEGFELGYAFYDEYGEVVSNPALVMWPGADGDYMQGFIHGFERAREDYGR